MSSDDIGRMRRRIRELDTQILELVAERLKAARRIGSLKRSESAPLRDYTVEAQVMGNAEEVCSRLGIDSHIGRDIAKLLIGAAVAVQSSSDARVYTGAKKRILIVGGNGKMGQWYTRFFNVQGHEVAVNDISGSSPFRMVDDLEKGAAESDIVLLSTPISATSSLLGRVLSAGGDALVMDGCSLKSPIASALKAAAVSGRRVTSIHMMFGPDTMTLADQNMIVCDCGNSAAAEEAASLFTDTCLSIRRMDLDSHDRIMSYLLGMTHAVNIMLFNALVQSGYSYAELSQLASTTFRKQMQTASDVARENPHLYYEIQNLNRHRDAVFGGLQKSLDELRSASFSDNSSSFDGIMEAGSGYFGGSAVE